VFRSKLSEFKFGAKRKGRENAQIISTRWVRDQGGGGTLVAQSRGRGRWRMATKGLGVDEIKKSSPGFEKRDPRRDNYRGRG